MAYEAIIVELKNIREHPDADKVNLVTIFGNQVVIGKDYKEGDIGLFFEVDTQLSKEFCYYNNLYRDPSKNLDPEKSGYFEDNRRVRAQTFRGEKSEGFFVPLNYLNYLLIGKIEVPVTLEYLGISIGDAFNSLYGQEICKKYVNPRTKRSRPQDAKKALMKDLAPLFKEHFDTEQYFKEIERNPEVIKEGDIIYITEKLHGTSLRVANGLVIRRRRTNFLERFFLGKDDYVLEKQMDYKFIVGSRKVIKSIDEKPITEGGFYNTDIWSIAAQQFKDNLYKGETIYAEIVGYLPDGAPIMGSHSNEKLKSFLSKEQYKEFIKLYGDTTTFEYGCSTQQGTDTESGKWGYEFPIFKVFVYRITMTNEDGITYDLSWEQVKKRCKELGVEYVPEVSGPMVINSNFEDTTIEALSEVVRVLTETPSDNFPGHVKEGVCIRIENGQKECKILKNKSFIFKVLEGIITDSNYIDLEEMQK